MVARSEQRQQTTPIRIKQFVRRISPSEFLRTEAALIIFRADRESSELFGNEGGDGQDRHKPPMSLHDDSPAPTSHGLQLRQFPQRLA